MRILQFVGEENILMVKKLFKHVLFGYQLLFFIASWLRRNPCPSGQAGIHL